MNEILEAISSDFPVLAVLLAVLIGLFRLANRTITILDTHLGLLLDKLERIADELQEIKRTKETQNRD